MLRIPSCRTVGGVPVAIGVLLIVIFLATPSYAAGWLRHLFGKGVQQASRPAVSAVRRGPKTSAKDLRQRTPESSAKELLTRTPKSSAKKSLMETVAPLSRSSEIVSGSLVKNGVMVIQTEAAKQLTSPDVTAAIRRTHDKAIAELPPDQYRSDLFWSTTAGRKHFRGRYLTLDSGVTDLLALHEQQSMRAIRLSLPLSERSMLSHEPMAIGRGFVNSAPHIDGGLWLHQFTSTTGGTVVYIMDPEARRLLLEEGQRLTRIAAIPRLRDASTQVIVLEPGQTAVVTADIRADVLFGDTNWATWHHGMADDAPEVADRITFSSYINAKGNTSSLKGSYELPGAEGYKKTLAPRRTFESSAEFEASVPRN